MSQEVSEHLMLALWLASWNVPFTGRRIEVGYAPDFNAKWPEGAANDE